ncbi:response regulator transcription factor [Telmatobacter bradus]|uniref:response regulator transcription factor n=1 Tax=Telmatobacter bradus TaxID=474953 RepID=UPI003B430DB1
MRILVVEDEHRLAENIALALREGPGYAVDVCHDGNSALLLCATVAFDLIVLDLMIPEPDGQHVLQSIRAQHNQTPVLILTAISETKSVIALLNIGADDYMTKPFDLGELIARARALVRRGKGVRQTHLTVGDVTLNLTEQTVSARDQQIDLSPTEFHILEYLMHHPRQIISKQNLLEHLYDFTWEHHSNVIEAHVSNLRRKLRAATAETVVENIRGRGYRLSAGSEVSA